MGAISGRRSFGLFTNAQAERGSNFGFTSYNYTNDDALSGDGCFVVDFNAYGSGMFGNEFIEVDPENAYYQFSVSVKTKTNNYLGNPGSGHLGFACYDANKTFISHHQAFSTLNTALTRAASPGDTVIYIGRGDWPNSTTNHIRSLNFYFPNSPYPNVGGYSRYNLYNPGYSLNGITEISASEWKVDLDKALPNFGYTYAIGTEVGKTQAGGSYNYAVGNPNYPSTWTTYTTGAMHGYVTNSSASGANFRDQTKFIRFLNLRNHRFRTQTAGNSARYYIDNIMLIKLKPPAPNTVSNFTPVSSNIFNINRFKVPRRGGQNRSDFL
jgi:hypothetical protein